MESGTVMKNITIQYYAILREQSGVNSEILTIDANTPKEIYLQLKEKYNFTLPAETLKIAINDTFADWNSPIADGDRLIFIPPVAGG